MNNYKYQQARDALKARIETMLPGTRLPNRNVLADELDIARTTLEHAISELTAQGLLHSRRGSGTYTTGRILTPQQIPEDPMDRWRALPTIPVRDRQTWALLVSDVIQDLAPTLVRGIEDEAQQNGIRLIVCNTDNNVKKQDDYLYQLTAGGISGIITMPGTDSNSDPRVWQAVKAHGVHVVSCFKPIAGYQTPGIFCNSHLAGMLAGEHLIACGCKRIAMVSGALYPVVLDRYHGLRSALYTHRMQADPSLFSYEHASNPDADALPHTSAFLSSMDFDGLFVFNDRLARTVYSLLSAYGRQPGKDVAIVSCDNTQICDMLEPTLSSVHFPVYEMGRQAAKLLYALCHGKAGGNYISVMDCSMFPRQSTLNYRRNL